MKYDVSAMIASYRPNYKKLIMTVRSLLLQNDVTLQIVVADDGSDKDYLEELKLYFHEQNFTDYVLVKNPINQGIVKNALSGFVKCEGEYVKPISPGDYMASDTALRDWIDYVKEKDIEVCGSDYFCYSNSADGKMKATRQKLHPYEVNLSGRALRSSYILYDDIFTGAATLCRTELLVKYVSLLVDKAKYAEDNCYRMMAYCGEKMGFYNNETILYEVGTGISTSGDGGPLLKKDWTATDNIMFGMEAEDEKMREQFELLKKYRGGRRSYNAYESMYSILR